MEIVVDKSNDGTSKVGTQIDVGTLAEEVYRSIPKQDAPGGSKAQADDALPDAGEDPGDAVDESVGSGPVDVAGHTAGDPALAAAAAGDASAVRQPAQTIDQVAAVSEAAVAAITSEHRDAFVDALVTGHRYTETFRLLGGSLEIVIRSRSVEETDAIYAYSRRSVATSRIRTDYEYSEAMRKLLATAQVESVNGVRYPEMTAPLYFEDHGGTLAPPGWEPAFHAWGGKSEALLSTVTKCIMEFEARYWHMISKARDANFWKPGESTGA